jgi:5-formaminoimidazole-4-carboxamide-1-(beta)-D-ribofuranosyl 5'-monophosphate synthetase
MNYTIATLASHSSLQILKGAKDEGLLTLAIATKDKERFYQRFPFIDEIAALESYGNFFDYVKTLDTEKVIMIPHGSFVAYLGADFEARMPVPYFGNKKILDIEGDRMKQHEWMRSSGILVPRIFNSADDVDRPVIVKLYGAKGGAGYFVAVNKAELKEKLGRVESEKYVIQEYVIGAPMYFQYFYSRILDRLELMGIDRRYESNADGLGRMPSYIQTALRTEASYTVVGNTPVVIRESLLPQVFDMGERVISTSRDLAPPKGLYGPFCLETIITPDMKIYCIEISCRIVAGTNMFVNGSPYTDLWFQEPMSTGRRIAREIQDADRLNRMHDILD